MSVVNCAPNGIRYGVIQANSLDPDLVHELFYGPGAVDLSYQAAYEEAKAEYGKKFDDLMEQAEMAATETDPNMTDGERESFIESWFDNHRPSDPYQGTPSDRDTYIEEQLEMFSDCCQIDEPTYEGEYEGVKYGLSTLGGAYLLWVFEGPEGNARSLCSPCCPGAADLDSGFVLDSELEGGPEWAEIGVSEFDHENGFPCYCVPRDWFFRKETT